VGGRRGQPGGSLTGVEAVLARKHPELVPGLVVHQAHCACGLRGVQGTLPGHCKR
jgi:hypothetical protein